MLLVCLLGCVNGKQQTLCMRIITSKSVISLQIYMQASELPLNATLPDLCVYLQGVHITYSNSNTMKS